MSRTIKVRCEKCNGDGWYPVQNPDTGEETQQECEACEAQGCFEHEIEVDENGTPVY